MDAIARSSQTATRRRSEKKTRSSKNRTELDLLSAQAGTAARMLKLLANKNRLLILCNLIARGEMKVGDLVEAVGLSQSALSQHLALLRADKLITFRRESQTLYYRVSDPRAAQILMTLKKIYCDEL
jgi:ArsR family transcriptional regulator, virulence genes transcriptional regulator